MSGVLEWGHLLSEVSKSVPPQQFRAWIESTKFIRMTDTKLVIGAPTSFARDWVTDHYAEIFQTALLNLYGLRLTLQVETQSADEPQAAADSTAVVTGPSETSLRTEPWMNTHKNEAPAVVEEAPSAPPSSQDTFSFSQSSQPEKPRQPVQPARETNSSTPSTVRVFGQPFDPKQTFETFVVGASNQFAHAAARAVAEHPASQYNPLFIYSDAGLGKTHLLHAVGNYVMRLNPKAKICYISAEKFVNDLIDSIHHGKMPQFRERYRDSYDILLMDDIQFIAGKDRTQEEFFHTFNALHSSRRQIVVTSDKFPKDIPGLEDRIRTRFEWGLVADIQPPEIETRIAILRAKAEMDDIFLPNDVALFLASNIKTNIRELEGCLIRLGAQASLTGSEISIDLAKQILRNILKEPSTHITPDLVQDAVARHFQIKISDLKSKERSRRVSLPRQIAMYLIRKYCAKSFPEIGLFLGGKDHSTIVYGVQSITAEIEKDAEIKRHVEEIQNSL